MSMVKDRNSYGDFCEDWRVFLSRGGMCSKRARLVQKTLPHIACADMSPSIRLQNGEDLEDVKWRFQVSKCKSLYTPPLPFIESTRTSLVAYTHLFSHLPLSFNYLAVSASTTLASGNFSANPHPHFTQDAAT
jgi:hypothetical protein